MSKEKSFREAVEEIQSDECERIGFKCLDFDAQKYKTCAECRTDRIMEAAIEMAERMPCNCDHAQLMDDIAHIKEECMGG